MPPGERDSVNDRHSGNMRVGSGPLDRSYDEERSALQDVQLIYSRPDVTSGTATSWEAGAWFGNVDQATDTATLTVYVICTN